MVNHHHFVLRLTDGGLLGLPARVHGRYSRRITRSRQTGTGHLVRHGFFGGESDAEILVVCPVRRSQRLRLSGCYPAELAVVQYGAAADLEKPQPFHEPDELLGISPD